MLASSESLSVEKALDAYLPNRSTTQACFSGTNLHENTSSLASGPTHLRAIHQWALISSACLKVKSACFQAKHAPEEAKDRKRGFQSRGIAVPVRRTIKESAASAILQGTLGACKRCKHRTACSF